MKAAIFNGESKSLVITDFELEPLEPFQIKLRVEACALCRTDLHVIDGDLKNSKTPLILGHEIVGVVVDLGSRVKNISLGERVGVSWLASSCLTCSDCQRNRENLCESALFTGYTINGGFAEYAHADSRFCFPIPATYDADHAAPLLCAGLIGWRSIRFTEDSKNIGIYGFGAAAHVITPVAIAQGKRIFAFTSPGDDKRQFFARSLGAIWAGSSDEQPPELLDAAIIFAPVGALVLNALRAVRRGGIVVCGGIHMSDIPSFPYSLLWEERTLKSVANLTRSDGLEFLDLASKDKLSPSVVTFGLDEINNAINEFRSGRIMGAAVIKPMSQ